MFILLSIIIILSSMLILLCIRYRNAEQKIKALEERIASLDNQLIHNEEEQMVGMSPNEKFYSKVNNIIDTHFEDGDFTVKEFARLMGMGKTAFGKRFKEVIGKPPNKYIILYKLEKALEYMRNDPEMSIKQIAYMFNFSSPSYFIKLFKEVYGETPSAFKKKKK